MCEWRMAKEEAGGGLLRNSLFSFGDSRRPRTVIRAQFTIARLCRSFDPPYASCPALMPPLMLGGADDGLQIKNRDPARRICCSWFVIRNW